MLDNSNHNGRTLLGQGGEPCGRAALLLVESLLHGLIDRSLISVRDAVDIIDVASEVEVDRLVDIGTADTSVPNTLTLLSAIRESLTSDLDAP